MSAMIGSFETLDLERFCAATRKNVRLKFTPWETAWVEILSYGLQNRGPDISQVGTTWLSSLVNIQSLAPFTQHEIEAIGGSEIFFPAAWETSTPPNEMHIFAIPWVADTRLIVYRRDVLAKAGIDETNAFASHEKLVETLTRLQNYGHPSPLALPTAEEVIHNVASWVWAQGGHFRSKNRYHLALTTPETLAGLKQFYELHHFIAPSARNLTTAQVSEIFQQGEPAVILTDQQLLPIMVYQSPPAFGLENVGAAAAPGIPFIGGSGLVVWQHAFQRDTALELIRFLCSYESQSRLLEHTHQIPVRGDVLKSELFTRQRLFKAIADSLKKGRAFKSSYQWGSIESRLFVVFNQLWQDLFASPGMDIEAELAYRMAEISTQVEKNLLSLQ